MEAFGITHLEDVSVRLLSSGQAKIATVARVAASTTSRWLLDEPLEALDGESVDRSARLIANHLKSRGAVLAASHQASPRDWRRPDLGLQRAAGQAGVMNQIWCEGTKWAVADAVDDRVSQAVQRVEQACSPDPAR